MRQKAYFMLVLLGLFMLLSLQGFSAALMVLGVIGFTICLYRLLEFASRPDT